MPWSQTMPRDQRVQFIADCLRNTLSMTERCDLYPMTNHSTDRDATCHQIRRVPRQQAQLAARRTSPAAFSMSAATALGCDT
jgi:hypothetical protein